MLGTEAQGNDAARVWKCQEMGLEHQVHFQQLEVIHLDEEVKSADLCIR